MLLCEQAPTQHLGICVCMAELFNFILSSAAGGLCGLSAAFFCLIIYAFIKSFPIYWISALENTEDYISRTVAKYKRIDKEVTESIINSTRIFGDEINGGNSVSYTHLTR